MQPSEQAKMTIAKGSLHSAARRQRGKQEARSKKLLEGTLPQLTLIKIEVQTSVAWIVSDLPR